MVGTRMTRQKAAELADQMHVDEDDLLEPPNENLPLQAKAHTPEPAERPALGELAPNSADGKAESQDGAQELKKSTRGRKGGKKGGATGFKNNLAASTAEPMDTTNDQQEVLTDENDSAPSPASEKPADELMKEVPEPEISHTSAEDTRPQSPAVRLTRSQLGKKVEFESEPKSLVDGLGQSLQEQDETMKKETGTMEANPFFEAHNTGEVAALEQPIHVAFDDPTSPLPSVVPKAITKLRADTPAKRSTSNKENVEPESSASPQSPQYDVLEHAVVAGSTPLASGRQSTAQPSEDPISALDELDQAVEDVNKDIPEVQTSPEKSKPEKKTKKAAPVVRTTKASQARISIAQTSKDGDSDKAPALGRARPSTTLGRASSVRQTTSTRSPSSKRILSGGNNADKGNEGEAPREKKEVVIPHSKPRPISLSFPTPPPPARSTKAPTQSTFQLPGEAVAAKLKAAREARAQREAEEEEKGKAFKARPVPTALSKAPSVRGTNASKARESIMSGKDPKLTRPTPAAGHSRAHSVATTQPTAAKLRVVSKDSSKPATLSSRLASSEISVKKRPSTALASTGPSATSRPSLSASTRAPSNPTKGTLKGKEVFGRAAAAKASAEKEKAEKEAAAKKARAEAAERGRLASREWAEKQKMKKLAAAAAKQAPEAKGEEPSSVVAEQVGEASAAVDVGVEV